MKKGFFIFCLCLTGLGNTQLLSAEPQKFRGITNLHNRERVARSQIPLRWSNYLALYASQWVNHLATTKNCSMVHRPNKGNSPFKQIYGENLYWASPEVFYDGRIKLQTVNVRNVFQAWEEEKNFYNYQTNRCSPGKDCGHFTQIVWHETQSWLCYGHLP